MTSKTKENQPYRQPSTPFTREGCDKRNQYIKDGDEVRWTKNDTVNDVRERSSAVEHTVHIGGVAGSIPAAPTIAPDDYWSYIYIFTAGFGALHRVKIGISANPRSRLQDLQVLTPFKVSIYMTWPALRSRARWVEKAAHALIADRRAHGEWFKTHGVTAKMAVDRAFDLYPEFGKLSGKVLRADVSWVAELKRFKERRA